MLEGYAAKFVPKTTTRVSLCEVTTTVSTGETRIGNGNAGDGVGTTRDQGAPQGGGELNRRRQGRGGRGADARSGPVLFRIRALGQKTGLITSWGGGAFGFMRSLALLGPLSVPQIAQMRPTSRQRMQRLADELAAEGHVRFIENPRHRRSKLVQLTPKGDARYRELNAQLLSIASTMVVALSEVDVRKTIEIVRHLSDDVKARSERLP